MAWMFAAVQDDITGGMHMHIHYLYAPPFAPTPFYPRPAIGMLGEQIPDTHEYHAHTPRKPLTDKSTNPTRREQSMGVFFFFAPRSGSKHGCLLFFTRHSRFAPAPPVQDTHPTPGQHRHRVQDTHEYHHRASPQTTDR